MNAIKIEPYPAEVEQARVTPDGWVYRIAGSFTQTDEVPPEAIVGAWKTDKDGCIVGVFQRNPNYDAKMWPLPS